MCVGVDNGAGAYEDVLVEMSERADGRGGVYYGDEVDVVVEQGIDDFVARGVVADCDDGVGVL